MPRKKPIPALTVSSLQEADKALEELASLERQGNAIKNALNEKVDEAKAKAAEDMTPLEARKKELEGALAAFAIMNKATLFKDKKSQELDFGTLSFRLSKKIMGISRGHNQETMLSKAKELGFLDAVRNKEELNKEALAAWPEEKLSQIGAKRKTEDTFGYELKQQEPGLTQAA